jgi:hypothetical protein
MRAPRWVLGATGPVVVSALLVAAVACGGGGASTSTASGQDGGETWSTLPEPPLSPRTGAGVVWAGTQLVVWGGTEAPSTNGPGPSTLSDGATWSPGGGWEPMAPPPANDGLAPQGFALWTGGEVVFGPVAAAGGGPSAVELLAYAPRTDSWRTVTPDAAGSAVLDGRADSPAVVAAVVGPEIVLGVTGGGAGRARPDGKLVALDPASGRSRALEPGPFDASPYPDLSGEVLLTKAGDRLLAVPNWAPEVWRLDPSDAGAWTLASRPPVRALHLNGAAWLGSEALFVEDHEPLAYDPAADGWRRLRRRPTGIPALRLDGGTAVVAAGDNVVAQGVGYEPARDRWYPLPALPVPPEQVLLDAYVGWTGDALVVFGGGRYSCPVDSTCEIDAEHVDWRPGGWILDPSGPRVTDR